MSGTDDTSSGFARAEAELLARWPESKVAPDLGRISALMDFIGEPQLCAPVIHIAGTNGKTSTARIVESLLREQGLTTGLFTSPSLESITERVQIDGEPISEARFAAAYEDIAPFLALLDEQAELVNGPPVTMFEAVTALAFACFADAPVDVMVIECGMGGAWDATNVVEPAVAVVTPVGLDHTDYLGDSLTEIATEKAGILKAGALAAFARQEPEAAAVLMARCVELDITPVREGVEFAVVNRTLAVGGQMLTIQGLGGEYDELYLPLHGEHQSANAALALAAVELFFDAGPQRQLDIDVVRAGLAAVTSPGRLERVRTSPTVIIDAAHNPAGARAVTAALAESFDFSRLVGVVAVLEGKDVRGILTALEPGFDSIVVTRNSSPRSLDVDDLAEIALDVFGEDRVFASPHLAEALDVAVGLVDDVAEWGSAAVVALGSVVTAADARRMMAPRPPRVPNDARELTYNLLPEGEEPDDDQVQAGLERGLGFNLPGFDPEDDPLDDDPDDDHLDADDDDDEEDS
ncbi:MAG: folylpolyglutamate synthase/dihydrofolate synthase family protein [Candidatus Nanopelagicales bacterium]